MVKPSPRKKKAFGTDWAWLLKTDAPLCFSMEAKVLVKPHPDTHGKPPLVRMDHGS